MGKSLHYIYALLQIIEYATPLNLSSTLMFFLLFV